MNGSEDTTLAEEIEQLVDSPTHAVIGEMGWSGFKSDGRHKAALAVKGKLLTWDEARPLLDYKYDAGYGSPDCHAICVWSDDSVAFVTQYDGSTGVETVPRNPTAHDPSMPGG